MRGCGTYVINAGVNQGLSSFDLKSLPIGQSISQSVSHFLPLIPFRYRGVCL